MCATRFFRISAGNIGPNRFHQNRTVSWLMSIPRSARRSSTLRNDSGYFTYIITTRRITSGELLKYRNGCSSPEATTAKRRPEKFVDTRFGFFVNHDLACYEVPVHADISAPGCPVSGGGRRQGQSDESKRRRRTGPVRRGRRCGQRDLQRHRDARPPPPAG